MDSPLECGHDHVLRPAELGASVLVPVPWMGLECRERVEAVLFVPLDMDIYLAVMRAEPIVGLAVDLDLPFRVLLFVKPVLRHDLLSVLEYPACSGVKLAVDRPHAV